MENIYRLGHSQHACNYLVDALGLKHSIFYKARAYVILRLLESTPERRRDVRWAFGTLEGVRFK